MRILSRKEQGRLTTLKVQPLREANVKGEEGKKSCEVKDAETWGD